MNSEEGTPLDKDVLDFLRQTIKGKSDGELQNAFGWVFERGRFGNEENQAARAGALRKYDCVIKELSSLPNDAAIQEIERILSDLPDDDLRMVKDDLEGGGGYFSEDASHLERALFSVKENRKMVRIWYKGNPGTGGKKVVAHLIADAVKLAFEDLGLPARHGHDPGNSKYPSTLFGKVIEEALASHSSSASWDKVTKAAADKRPRYRKKKY